MQIKPLRGRKVVDRVRRRGTKWRGKHMNCVYLLIKEPGGIFVGTSASTKLNKSAVKRNRMRRRCREALRVTICNTTSTTSVPSVTSVPSAPSLLLLTPKSSSLTCGFDELRADAEALLTHLSKHVT